MDTGYNAMGIKLVSFFCTTPKAEGGAKTKNDSIVKMGAGDKPVPNVCCRTPMEYAPPVFFAKREGDAECKTVISLDFDGLRAEQDGFTA